MGIHQSNANSQSRELLSENGISLINKGQNMLHKLSLDAMQLQVVMFDYLLCTCISPKTKNVFRVNFPTTITTQFE